MDIYTESIRCLPLGERLKLIQTIWDDIVSRDEQIPLPQSAIEEAKAPVGRGLPWGHPSMLTDRFDGWPRQVRGSMGL